MARHNLSALVRYLRQLVRTTGDSGVSDAELLERYVRRRDEAAFELLLWRHGALVFNVCRRILPSEQDAEDAFQATFLTFVRKAGSINRRGSVAAWLYKVAYRVALEAKKRLQKSAAAEKAGGEAQAVASADDPLWSDVRPILDEELNRLPEHLRRPIVLCYLEGKSNEEAARELGCRLGTIYSRLSRGRELLRQRLQRRGMTLPAAALAVLSARAAEAAPAISLVRAAARAALAFADPSAAANVSPRVAALAEGVLRTMFVTKLKIAAVMLLVIGVAAGGMWTQARTAAPQARSVSEGTPLKPADGDKKDAEPIAVKVVKPKKGGLPLMVIVPAQIVAAQQQQVVPLISGTVKEVRVDIGDRVKKGQTLIVFDAPLLGKEVEQAIAALKMAEAQVEEAEAQMVVAKAEVVSAKASLSKEKAELNAAKTTLKAAEELAGVLQKKFESGTLPMQAFGEAKEKVVAARAKVQLAEPAITIAEAVVQVKLGKLALARAAWKRAGANVNSSQATVDKARIQESFTELKAAFDGYVTRRTIDPGNCVQSSDSRLLRPLLTVQRIDRVRLTAQIDEVYVSLIRLGLPVEIERPAVEGHEYKVSRFSPALENVNPVSGSMTVEIDVPNNDNRLLPGMAASVKLPLHKTLPHNLIVPSTCVVQPRPKDNAPYPRVYIVRDGKVSRRFVTVRIDDGQNTEITRGIQASDLIIIKPGVLAEGVSVKIEKGP